MTEDFETHLQAIAQNLPYPPTPSLTIRPPALRTTHLRWRHALLIVLLLGFSSLMIPDIRAAIAEFLQIGAVRIYLEGPNEEGQPLDLAQVSGETDLEAARTLVNFPIHIPPDDPPDRVFVQDPSLIIMVWISEGKIERALYETSNDNAWFMVKSAETITWTRVAGRDAAWVTLPHPVEFIRNGVVYSELTHFVTGHVLIWEQDSVTFRLETHASLEEAQQFAEALVVPE